LAEFLGLDASWILTGEEPVEQREMLEELREIRTAQEDAVEQMKQARDETMTALRELRQLIENGTESL
jgi:DNA-binding protein YbaB